ncbi:MAG: divergent PAP2 family protein [Candidatus Woesearchaeota archaeon]|jgi:hypothetical protein
MNKILISVILAGFGVQLIKLIIFWFRHKTLHWKDILVTGGMPSSHSAFVVSLATMIYLMEGVSTAFVISLVLAFIIVRDAFGVRRTVGEEGMVIQKMMQKLKLHKQTHFSMGHTPLQVTVGSILGFLIAIGVFYLL